MTSPKQRPAAGPRRILMVHERSRKPEAAVRAIEAAHDVVEVRGTRHALAQLHSHGPHFDLVVVACLARKGQRAYAAAVAFVRALP